MAKKKKEETPMQASRNSGPVMPDSNNQGWGVVTGIKTQESEILNHDWSRTIYRTSINNS